VEYCENLEIVDGLVFLGDYGGFGSFLVNICNFLNYISRRVYMRCIDDFNAVNKMLQKVQKYVEYCENLEIVEGFGFRV
jgi:hypothetical protein